jgi:hypothetical protein
VPVTAISTSDVSKTSNVTPAAHAQLKVALEANGLYLIRGNIQYGGDPTADISLGLSGPSGAATVGGVTIIATVASLTASPSPAYVGTGIVTLGLGQVQTLGNAGTSGGDVRRLNAIVEAVVQMSSTAGDLSVIWSQQTTSVNPVLVFTGSTLTATKIG